MKYYDDGIGLEAGSWKLEADTSITCFFDDDVLLMNLSVVIETVSTKSYLLVRDAVISKAQRAIHLMAIATDELLAADELVNI
ncbi:hypothetical protein MUK42_35561 [Musa troglodytarum]|uniref:Uncharacterized protein n=1 Tax=Musa troglodytarum TaxID=320322 RepID=A0A9E7E8H1_9LILI|nr:hypothetical protein MUK42_35561 [Musa troglodytarum]